jgi:hypothetical protein
MFCKNRELPDRIARGNRAGTGSASELFQLWELKQEPRVRFNPR